LGKRISRRTLRRTTEKNQSLGERKEQKEGWEKKDRVEKKNLIQPG